MREFTEVEIAEIEEPTERMFAWGRNSALFRLNQKDMSESELKNALKRKALQKFTSITAGCADKIAAAALSYCLELKLIDDDNYARMKVKTESNKGKSKRMIAKRLSDKGIAPETSLLLLQETDDLVSALIHCRKRRLGPYRRDSKGDAKTLARELGNLARNGFSQDVARKALSMNLEDVEATLAEI